MQSHLRNFFHLSFLPLDDHVSILANNEHYQQLCFRTGPILLTQGHTTLKFEGQDSLVHFFNNLTEHLKTTTWHIILHPLIRQKVRMEEVTNETGFTGNQITLVPKTKLQRHDSNPLFPFSFSEVMVGDSEKEKENRDNRHSTTT